MFLSLLLLLFSLFSLSSSAPLLFFSSAPFGLLFCWWLLSLVPSCLNFPVFPSPCFSFCRFCLFPLHVRFFGLRLFFPALSDFTTDELNNIVLWLPARVRGYWLRLFWFFCTLRISELLSILRTARYLSQCPHINYHG